MNEPSIEEDFLQMSEGYFNNTHRSYENSRSSKISVKFSNALFSAELLGDDFNVNTPEFLVAYYYFLSKLAKYKDLK